MWKTNDHFLWNHIQKKENKNNRIKEKNTTGYRKTMKVGLVHAPAL